MKANAKIRNIQDLMVSILILVFFCFCLKNLILFTQSGLAMQTQSIMFVYTDLQDPFA